MRLPSTVLATALMALMATAPLCAGETAAAPTLKDFLEKIADKSVDVRYAARLSAPQFGAAAVVPLGEMIVHQEREVAITARAALELVVHSAGRPGAFAERAPVAAELLKLLAADRPPTIKREALHLIAFIGDDAAVPPAAALLGDADPTVREAARLCLERIPAAAALAALIDAAKKAPADRKPDLIFSISKKGEKSVVKDLTIFASAEGADVRFAALEALARLGVAEAATLFPAEIAKTAGPDQGRLWTEYLRLADGLKASNAAAAASIYREALAKASLDFHRDHALGALCPEGKLEGLPLLAAALADASPRVRRLAAVRLEALKGPEVLQTLEKIYNAAKGDERPAILRALAERDPAAAKPFLEKAATESSPELKITALDLLGRMDDPAMEDAYRRAAESGADWLKPVALKGYLILGRKKLDSGAKAEALPIFGRAMDLARDPGQRLEALRGIIAVGDPKEITRLQPILQDPQLGGEASQGFVAFAAAIGKAGDKAGAEKYLLPVLTGDFSREVKTKAAEELKNLGLDPQRVARTQGFVLDWWVVTPIADTDGKAMETKMFPEEAIQLDEVARVEARRYRWQRVKDITLDGRIDLLPLFRKSEKVVTYAYTELESPSDQTVLFKMGSDDGLICWLNGEKIQSKPEPRGFQFDDDSVEAKLKAGVNKVLLKIGQQTGPWEFCLRVTGQDGKPMDLKAVVK